MTHVVAETMPVKRLALGRCDLGPGAGAARGLAEQGS